MIILFSGGFNNLERTGTEDNVSAPYCHLSQMHTTNYILFIPEKASY